MKNMAMLVMVAMLLLTGCNGEEIGGKDQADLGLVLTDLFIQDVETREETNEVERGELYAVTIMFIGFEGGDIWYRVWDEETEYVVQEGFYFLPTPGGDGFQFNLILDPSLPAGLYWLEVWVSGYVMGMAIEVY